MTVESFTGSPLHDAVLNDPIIDGPNFDTPYQKHQNKPSSAIA